MSISQVVNLVIRSNDKYANFLKKDVKFIKSLEAPLLTDQVFTVVSILNNLVGNSLEAISTKGIIEIGGLLKGENLCLWVKDNGSGISQDKKDIIFDPGYTTKFSDVGVPSSGMGLSQVKMLVEKLNGEVKLAPTPTNEAKNLTGACFSVNIPIKNLMKGD